MNFVFKVGYCGRVFETDKKINANYEHSIYDLIMLSNDSPMLMIGTNCK